jgi:hypothetical protein
MHFVIFYFPFCIEFCPTTWTSTNETMSAPQGIEVNTEDTEGSYNSSAPKTPMRRGTTISLSDASMSSSFKIGKSLFDFNEDDNGDELHFQEGELIEILEELDDGWCVGRNPAGDIGMFPANFIEVAATVGFQPLRNTDEDQEEIHELKRKATLAKNVVNFAKIATPTTGRYYFWIDDGMHMCHPKVGDIYSDSDQATMMENYLLRELRKFDPRATIAHLSYANTLTPPEKTKPDTGVFLEFAPISRSYDVPYRKQNSKAGQGWVYLKENLKVFPASSAQILEYWVDVSLFSTWKRPFKELPWEKINRNLEK